MKKPSLPFLLGLGCIAAYLAWVMPPGRGYIEDLCHMEQARQIMAENLSTHGHPTFTTESFGAPAGISVAFMSWSVESAGLGALFWLLDRDFPFYFALFAASLLIIYGGVGTILRRMGVAQPLAWALATLLCVMHAPRHFKAWHHTEHLIQHWLTLSLFLDARIWQRFWRERRVSLRLEAWRALLMLATFNNAGYFWGVAILEWTIVRGCMVWLGRTRSIRIERDERRAWPALVIAVPLLALQLSWFVPLALEARKIGTVWQPMGWFSSIWTVMRPLWLEPLYAVILRVAPGFPVPLTPLTYYETLTAIGWMYWVPAVIGLRELRKRGDLRAVLPFLILLGIGIEYVSIWPHWVQETLRTVVPFMSFFRVGSRWGLIFPQLVLILTALSWPELSAWVRTRWRSGAPRFRAWVAAFAMLCLLETHVLAHRPEMLPALSDQMLRLLDDVKQAPGTTVLDMPFCLAGGNEVCTGAKCLGYPYSTAGACFHGWHDKRVFGIYESRLIPEQCTAYDPAPYSSWFAAWHGKRCLTPPEWVELCGFLNQHSEIGAVLVYPDIWQAAGTPECEAQFAYHLGTPLAEAQFAGIRTNGGWPHGMQRVRLYDAAECRRGAW